MYLLVVKFISRNPKKSMGYIRDISVAIILLLSVGALLTTINGQISFLFGLAPSSNTILIRNLGGPIDENFVPADLEDDLKTLGFEKILPTVHKKTNITYFNEDIEKKSQFNSVFTNISLLSELDLIKSLSPSQISNISSNDAIIGSILAKNLGINPNTLPVEIKIDSTSNASIIIKHILLEPDIYQNNLVMNLSMVNIVDPTYNYSYYSELLIKLDIRDNIDIIQSEISVLLAQYPECNCDLIIGTGSSSLISIIVEKLSENISIFFQIINIIIFIRLFQALLWIGKDFKYELHILKILGTSKSQMTIIFLFFGLIFGNLAIILSMIGILIIPAIISIFLSVITLTPVFIPVPNEVQFLDAILWLNVLFILSSLYPAIKIARTKVLSPSTREI